MAGRYVHLVLWQEPQEGGRAGRWEQPSVCCHRRARRKREEEATLASQCRQMASALSCNFVLPWAGRDGAGGRHAAGKEEAGFTGSLGWKSAAAQRPSKHRRTTADREEPSHSAGQHSSRYACLTRDHLHSFSKWPGSPFVSALVKIF